MKLKYLFCILIFIEIFTLRGISFSQTGSVTNISRIDNLINESLIPVENEIVLLGKDKFYNLSVKSKDGNSDQKSYLIVLIKNKLSGYNILIDADSAENSESINYNILIDDLLIKTRYISIYNDNVLGTKKIKREISVSYDMVITDIKNSSVVFDKKFNKKSEDSFNVDEQNSVEDNRYNFSQSNLPEESSLNKLIYPAIIILASAIAIVLFFTIRSK